MSEVGGSHQRIWLRVKIDAHLKHASDERFAGTGVAFKGTGRDQSIL